MQTVDPRICLLRVRNVRDAKTLSKKYIRLFEARRKTVRKTVSLLRLREIKRTKDT